MFGENVRKVILDAGLGCPNRDGTIGNSGCIYCNDRGSGSGAQAAGVPINEQLRRGTAFLSARYKTRKFIAYFQSFTNTYAPLSVLERLYEEALSSPEVVGMAVGTRPDCVPDEVLDLVRRLAGDRLCWMEYGLQSAHERTLRLLNRAHGPGAFFDAVQRTRNRGILTVAHLILGLPGETIEDMKATARAVADAGIDGVKLHPLYVIRGTELERMHIKGEYRPLTEDEALEAIEAVLRCLPRNIVVHRLTSDPHSAELVEPQWMSDKRGVRKRLDDFLEERDVIQGSDL